MMLNEPLRPRARVARTVSIWQRTRHKFSVFWQLCRARRQTRPETSTHDQGTIHEHLNGRSSTKRFIILIRLSLLSYMHLLVEPGAGVDPPTLGGGAGDAED